MEPFLQTQLQAARCLLESDHRAGLAALEGVFNAAAAPSGLPEGDFAGELFGFRILPGLNALAGWLAGSWRPWLGKTFDARQHRGENLVHTDFLRLSRLIWPLYRGGRPAGPHIQAAFPFRVYPANSLASPEQPVLRIDYNLETNPRFIVRQVRDEIVSLGENAFLGRAFFRTSWGPWRRWAYFTLQKVDWEHESFFTHPL